MQNPVYASAVERKPRAELTKTPLPKRSHGAGSRGPGPMEFLLKSRESLVRAWSSPRAVATEAAPSSPQSVAAQLAASFKRWG